MKAGAPLREKVLFQVDDVDHYVAAFRSSPDHSRFTYVYAPRGVEVGSLWLFDRATGERTSLGRQDHGYWSPAWSPDGKALAVCSSRTGAGEVWILPLSGGPHRLLTTQGANVAQVSWSPRHDRLAFLANSTGAYELWLVRSDGAEEKRLTDQALWIDPFSTLGNRAGASLAWSPAGDRIAVSASHRAGEEQWITEIRIFDLATGHAKRIFARETRTRDECALLDLSFSPHGRYLAFRRCIGEKYHLLVVSATGKRVLKRKYIGSLADLPWSPDGERLVCATEPGLLEIHDLRRRTATLLRQSGGLHRLRTPVFDDSGHLIYGRGAALACLPAPGDAAESSFALDSQPPAATHPEIAHRESTAGDLSRLRRDLEEMALTGLAVAAEVARAAAHISLRPAVHGLLVALPREALDPLLADTLHTQDPVALATVLAGLVEREFPCGSEVLDELAATLEPDRRLTAAVRAGVLRLLSDCGRPPRPEFVRAAIADPQPALRAAGLYALLRSGTCDPAEAVAAIAIPAAQDWVRMDLPTGDLDPGRRHVWRNILGTRSRGDTVALHALLALHRAKTHAGEVLLAALLAHSDEVVRVWALHYLEDLAPAPPWDRVTAMRHDPCPAVRSAAITALSRRSAATDSFPNFVCDLTGRLEREAHDESDYWEVKVRGIVRCAAGPTAGVTLSLEIADRCQVQELPAMAEGWTLPVDFFYSLALWEPVPATVVILIESREGSRTTVSIPITLS